MSKWEGLLVRNRGLLQHKEDLRSRLAKSVRGRAGRFIFWFTLRVPYLGESACGKGDTIVHPELRCVYRHGIDNTTIPWHHSLTIARSIQSTVN